MSNTDTPSRRCDLGHLPADDRSPELSTEQSTGQSEADPDAPPEDTPGRIVAAAARCFYRDGIYATGVDALAAEAGISKRTLYNHFPSKDSVIAAYLRQREAQWERKLAAVWEEVGDDPALQVISYVRGYAIPVADEVFRGSAFINAAAELSDSDHEALGVIQNSMHRMEVGLTEILSTAGVADARRVATRILYLIEGGVAVGGVRRDSSCLDDAEYFIALLLEECGVSLEAARAAS